MFYGLALFCQRYIDMGYIAWRKGFQFPESEMKFNQEEFVYLQHTILLKIKSYKYICFNADISNNTYVYICIIIRDNVTFEGFGTLDYL